MLYSGCHHIVRRAFHSRSLPPRLVNASFARTRSAPLPRSCAELRPWKQVTLYKTRLAPWGFLAIQRRTRHVASRSTASFRIEEVQKSFLGSPARTIRDSLLLFRMLPRVVVAHFSIYKLQRGLYIALYDVLWKNFHSVWIVRASLIH